MNVIRYSDDSFANQLEKLAAPSSLFDPEIEQRTRSIIEAVRRKGDAALTEFAAEFDRVQLSPDRFRLSPEELQEATQQTDTALAQAIAEAQANIEAFSLKGLRKDWSIRNHQKAKVGEKYDPFTRVGIYIPGGTAPLISTVLMTVTLAKVAGCREVAVCTPCGKGGEVNPALLHTAQIAGASEVYRLGGAQAIAAMAYGTPSIARVQKVFGPGNAYVVAAKRLLFGVVAIDLLPGPSEVLILADDTAPARFIAADLLAQAEHGSGHERIWLITPHAPLIDAVQAEIERQLPALSRRTFIEESLAQNGWLIQVKTLQAGIELANQLAPEHCEVMTRSPAKVSQAILTAGAICVGAFSPNVLGDYLAGPSHVLPTGGAGISFPGLTVDQFQRRTSLIQYNREALSQSLATVQTFAALEGLDAHSRSAAVRLEEA